MSQFRGRRNENGDWEWEGTATSVLRTYSAPLLIGAILALAMLAYVFASHGWSFSPVAPDSCATTGEASAQHEDCTPCPENADASAQNNDECHTCVPSDDLEAQIQWWDLPTCTPEPTPSPSTTASPPAECRGEVDEDTGECHTCSPREAGGDATTQWFDLPTCTPEPTPSPTPVPTIGEPATSTPAPTCEGGEVDEDTGECHTCSPREDGGDATIEWFDLPTCTPAPTPTTPPTDTPTPVPTDTPSPTPTAPPTDTPTPAPATDTPTPVPTPKTDIALVKTDNPDPVARSGTLTYSITVTNVSDVDAENIVVTDTLSADVTLISATPTQGSCEVNVCSLGTIGAGKAAGIAVVVTVNGDAAATFTNHACAVTSTPETNVDNNCDDEDTHVPTPTPLPATSTPRAMPRTGGLPGDGGSDDRLLVGLGIGLLMAGAFATSVARRRVYKSTMEM